MGVFPRVARWDDDDRKDLLLGTEEGKVRLYLNIGTDAAPIFDEGVHLQYGSPGEKIDIDHSCSGAPCIVDWDEDGRRDLLMGGSDGRFHLYMNEGTDHAPDYLEHVTLQGANGDLQVPLSRSSPTVADFDEDGKKDIVAGCNGAAIIFFPNRGENDAPLFDYGHRAESLSVPIFLGPSGRTRPCVCDWTDDGILDLVVGSSLGLVHLFEGIEFSVDITPPALASKRLLPPWPNPANPAVTLAFALEEELTIRLSILDVSGRRVALLAEGVYGVGRHELIWRGRDDGGADLPSAVYLAMFEAGGTVESRKVVLLR
jgi:hypothetical protein